MEFNQKQNVENSMISSDTWTKCTKNCFIRFFDNFKK